MKTIIISLVLFLSTQFFAQDLVVVNINIIASEVMENEIVYITGNDVQLGNWNPSLVSLKQINDSLWTKTFSFSQGTDLEFKFTKGTWLKEAVNEDGTIPQNNILRVLNDTSINYSIRKWKDQIETTLSGQITGTVEYIRNFESEGLEPRDIIIWLPPSYDSLIDKSYPVLYMHDGQNIIDPATSSFNIDWQLDETADSLIKAGAIEEIIIVGIYNTFNRRSEYSPNDTGYRYMDFIVHELKPFVDKNYRTKPEPEFTAVGGSSMGGLISFMLAWEYPHIFSKAACLSPTFIYNEFNYVKNVNNYDGSQKPVLFYIDNGGIDLEQKLQPGIDDMMKVLKEKGYKIDKDYFWYKDENAVHSESAWAERVWRFLILFFSR
ncbi:MAG: alpha/beta hydrolase-fold protein [Ignavibacteriaceae bacterium]|nr:alpha/beta hydrolase-fold protein [Ignavibacteriaceae bacterium]